MKALILYFSGTGNTKYVAQRLEAFLKKMGSDTELHSTEDKESIKPDSYDLLALGCPKYYEYPVLDFVQYIKKNLPNSKQTVPTVIFCTQAGTLETDFKPISKILTKKNHKLIAEKSIPIANNLLTMKAFIPTTPEKTKSNLEQAEKEVEMLASCLMNNQEKHETVGTFFGGTCHATAVMCTNIFPAFVVRFTPSEKCIGCSLCAKKCPKQNIKMVNGKPEFGKNCIFCTRCLNICPANAILYRGQEHPQYKLLEKTEKIPG